MERRHWSIFPVAVFLLAACGPPSGTKDLPLLSAHVTDLPHSMQRISARWWTNARAAKRDGTSLAIYDRHGRLRSYDVRFDRRTGPTPTYLQGVESEITAYRSAAGARWAFEKERSATSRGYMWGSTTLGTDRGLARVSVPFKALRIPSVGTGRTAYTSTWGGDEFDYTTDVALFWRGRHVVRLQVTAILGHTAAYWIDALARAIDRRLIWAT